MLSSTTLTYSRYGQTPQFNSPRREAQPDPSRAPRIPAAYVPAPVRQDQSQELQQMRALVDRLNSRLNASSEVQFRLEEHKNQSRIVMTEQGSVVSSFGRHDLDELEGQLHEMAGFRLSVLT